MIKISFLKKLCEDADRDEVAQLVVGAVVHQGDEVLVLQRPIDDYMGGIFELPSGKVEPGESLDTALVREVKEETGLDVLKITHYLDSFDYKSGSGKKSRQFNFAVTVENFGPIKLQEHDAFDWVELTDQIPVTEAVKTTLSTFRNLRDI